MSVPAIPPDDRGAFVTINCVDVLIDGPADYTVRPIPPGPLREHAKRERAKIYGSPEPETKPPSEKGPTEK